MLVGGKRTVSKQRPVWEAGSWAPARHSSLPLPFALWQMGRGALLPGCSQNPRTVKSAGGGRTNTRENN